MDLTHARVANANALLIDLDLRNATPVGFDVGAFKKLLSQHFDSEGLNITLRTRVDGASAEIKLGMDWQITPTNELLTQLKKLRGVKQVAWE